MAQVAVHRNGLNAIRRNYSHKLGRKVDVGLIALKGSCRPNGLLPDHALRLDR